MESEWAWCHDIYHVTAGHYCVTQCDNLNVAVWQLDITTLSHLFITVTPVSPPAPTSQHFKLKIFEIPLKKNILQTRKNILQVVVSLQVSCLAPGAGRMWQGECKVGGNVRSVTWHDLMTFMSRHHCSLCDSSLFFSVRLHSTQYI